MNANEPNVVMLELVAESLGEALRIDQRALRPGHDW